MDGEGRTIGIVTMANIYEFEGFTFEDHFFCGPMKLNRSGEPSKRAGRKFYAAYAKWQTMTDAKRRATRISG